MNSNGYSLKNLSKYFIIDGETVDVLKGVNLKLPGDKITVVLGKSGCGKTTLLRILGGLEEASSGEVTYNDHGEQVIPKVGNVFQESRLMPWLTVEDNICIHMNNPKIGRAYIKKHLNMMGLEDFDKAYPSQLSGGMAQRVAIARALAYEPNLLLMDEPFSSLDYFTRLGLQKELISIYEKTQKGIIFVTHNIDEALMLGQNILIMRKGEAINEYPIPYGYPRDLGSPFFNQAKKDLLALF